MIVHTIAFNLVSQDAAEREEQLAEFTEMISSLNGKIPGLIQARVGRDIGKLDWHHDVAVITEHESVEALEAYQAHELHVPIIEWGKTRLTDRACVDFEV